MNLTSTEKPIIGFIGLGIMGRPMSKNLLSAGYPLVVYTRTKSKIEEMEKLGAKGAASPKDVASESDVVITMLPDSPEVEEVILGENGVIEGIRPETVVIDMSSIDPVVTRKVGAELAQKGANMLDAPVSGGESGAIKGELAIMVGGDKEVFERCLPIFQAMGRAITYMGGLGSGQTTKLVNQIIVGINIAALSEAFAFGAKAGLSAEDMHRAISGGMAGSRVMEMMVPRFVKRDFKPGFKLDLHIKDLKNAINAGMTLKSPLPLASFVEQAMISLSAEGKGESDHGCLVELWEELSGAEVR